MGVFLQLITRMSFTESPPWLLTFLLNPQRGHQDGTPPRDFFFPSRGTIDPLKLLPLANGWTSSQAFLKIWRNCLFSFTSYKFSGKFRKVTTSSLVFQYNKATLENPQKNAKGKKNLLKHTLFFPFQLFQRCRRILCLSEVRLLKYCFC